MSKKRAQRTNVYFKIDDENRLIDLVRRYEELYDPRQRMRDMHVRKKIWTEIGVKLGRTDSDCARKWRSIKQDYMNRLRNRISYGRYDVSRLSFLDEFIKQTPRQYKWKKNSSSGTETSAQPKTPEEYNVLSITSDNNIIAESDNDIDLGQSEWENNEIHVDITNDFIIKESVDGGITLDLVAENSFVDDGDSLFEEEINANNDSTQEDTTTPDIIPKDDGDSQERLNSKSPKSFIRPMIQFTNDEENRLIDFVKKNQKLYHPRHKMYPKQKKMEIWKTIGDEFGKSARICKKKWLTIKRDYQRSLQDSTVNSIKRYYKKRLSFLDKFTRVPMTFLRSDDRCLPRRTNYFKQSNKKFGFFHDQLNICSASELELYFHWVYKSVGTLSLKEQTRIRIEINKMVVNVCLRKK